MVCDLVPTLVTVTFPVLVVPGAPVRVSWSVDRAMLSPVPAGAAGRGTGPGQRRLDRRAGVDQARALCVAGQAEVTRGAGDDLLDDRGRRRVPPCVLR